jgi:uncharacterized caspase-like protein
MTRYHAVLIGINDYADTSIPNLGFARADAERFQEMLEASVYRNDITVYPLLDENATRANVLDLIAVDLSRSAAPEDIVIIFFAGHGSPEVYPSLDVASRFLVCHDTRRTTLFSSAIEIGDDLRRLAARLTSRLVLFVLDACFSGYTGGRGIIGPQLEFQRRTYRAEPKLADLPLGEGIAFMAAAADDEVALEQAALGHGVFSYYLLAELLASGIGVLGIGTLYDRVAARVRERTNEGQNPVLWGTVKGAGLPLLGAQ